MTRMSVLIGFVRDESGASAMEYALIVALVSLGATTFGSMGNSLVNIYTRVTSEMNAVIAP
jgi:Flp pilus assembly pilin Flp